MFFEASIGLWDIGCVGGTDRGLFGLVVVECSDSWQLGLSRADIIKGTLPKHPLLCKFRWMLVDRVISVVSQQGHRYKCRISNAALGGKVCLGLSVSVSDRATWARTLWRKVGFYCGCLNIIIALWIVSNCLTMMTVKRKTENTAYVSPLLTFSCKESYWVETSTWYTAPIGGAGVQML